MVIEFNCDAIPAKTIKFIQEKYLSKDGMCYLNMLYYRMGPGEDREGQSRGRPAGSLARKLHQIQSNQPKDRATKNPAKTANGGMRDPLARHGEKRRANQGTGSELNSVLKRLRLAYHRDRQHKSRNAADPQQGTQN